jgi:hypothetical protein
MKGGKVYENLAHGAKSDEHKKIFTDEQP